MAGPFRATPQMASAARRGRRLRGKFGHGGTDIGAGRAPVGDQRTLDAGDITSMHSYFAHHAVDADTGSHRGKSDTDPSAGFVAWLLWGGDAGTACAEREINSPNEPA